MNRKVIFGILCLLTLIMISFSVTAPGAVRVNDQFTTPCGIGIAYFGYGSVLINGRSAVRVGDSVAGGVVLGGNVVTGSSTVFIGGQRAARFNDAVTGTCYIYPAPIPFIGYFYLASPNVIIG